MIDRSQKVSGDESSVVHETIVLTDNTPLWRDCLSTCLEFDSYTVLSFPTLASWLDVRSKYPSPSIVVVCEPSRKELSLVARVAKDVATIVIAQSESGANLAQLLSTGVRGIILSSTTLKIALHVIRLVRSGGTFIPADCLSGGEGRSEFGNILTERQMDVVEALRQGKANKQIARDLNLRESTVKVHIRQIMRKLDANNRTEIAVLANELLEIGRESNVEEPI